MNQYAEGLLYTEMAAYLSWREMLTKGLNNLRFQIKTLVKSNTPKGFRARGERFSLKFLFASGYYSTATGGGVLSRCHSFTPFTSLSPPKWV